MGKRGILSPDPEAIALDGVSYSFGRYMDYHPNYHPNHGKPFSREDLEYLCTYYDFDDIRTLAFALGRTERTCICRYGRLKKLGLLDYYRNAYKRKWEAN